MLLALLFAIMLHTGCHGLPVRIFQAPSEELTSVCGCEHGGPDRLAGAGRLDFPTEDSPISLYMSSGSLSLNFIGLTPLQGHD